MKNKLTTLFRLNVTFESIGIIIVYLFLTSSFLLVLTVASTQLLPESTVSNIKNWFFNDNSQTNNVSFGNEETEKQKPRDSQPKFEFTLPNEKELNDQIFEKDRTKIDSSFNGQTNNNKEPDKHKSRNRPHYYPGIDTPELDFMWGPLAKVYNKYDVEDLNIKTSTDLNIMYALYWLRDHQNTRDGCWHAGSIKYQCETNSYNPYKPKFSRNGVCNDQNEVAKSDMMFNTASLTALSSLAFLGKGFTQEDGPFKLTVKKALRYILSIQEDNGSFVSTDDEKIMLTQSVCTYALAEAYDMTKLKKFTSFILSAIDFIKQAQNIDSETGWSGWGFQSQDGKSNTFVTTWVVMALTTAKNAGLEVPDRCFEGAYNFLNSVTSHPILDKTEDKYPRTGFEAKFGNDTKYEKNPMMDSMNIFSRRIMGTDKSDSFLNWQAELMAFVENGNLPTTEKPEKIDFLYWNLASLAMFQMGDTYWYQWKKPAYESIVKLQRLENENACAYGSWDPVDTWGSMGGRVYATAINALTLETEYRYKFIGQ